MDIPLVDLKAEYAPLKAEIRASLDEILEGMYLFLGKNVQSFEQEFADFCGTEFAVGVGSGTEALHLALLALGVGEGDEVITVSHTFIATVEAICHTGARPVFVDIHPQTYLMDVSQVEARITENTKAIVPVHLYGQPVDMDRLLELADRYDLKIVEDACQAHGAEYKGRPAGSMGNLGCFSFYFSKNLGAYGEAGAVVTSDAHLAHELKLLRDHGQETKYCHKIIGYNSRLDEIQAAVLRIKLKRLADWNDKRRQNARLYDRLLEGTSVITPLCADYGKHVYHLYVVRAEDRDGLSQWLDDRGIQTGIHYPIPCHLQEACATYGKRLCDLPVTEEVANHILSLPMYPALTSEQIETVVQATREFQKHAE
jgi:dTDP-4-amino-4,6-dideoxygalactose transaminase